jgi:hypothetical protein
MAGRPKGSMNQRWIDKLAALYERDLFREVLGHLDNLPDDKQAELKIKLMEFVVPKRKAVEHSGEINDGTDQELVVQETMKRIAQIEADKQAKEEEERRNGLRVVANG